MELYSNKKKESQPLECEQINGKLILKSSKCYEENIAQ